MRSQADRIIDHLATGRKLTPLQALSKFGSLRLGARVYELKQQGHDIRSKLVKRGGKQFAEYWLA